MTREFKLYNANGDMIDFLENLDIFGINPEGLGVAFESTFQTTNSNFLVEESRPGINKFEIDVAFGAMTGHSYLKFDQLISVLNAPPYRLVYTTEAGSWNRQCQLSELTKTEIKELNIMIERLSLDLLSPWYNDTYEETVIAPEQDGDGKIYAATKASSMGTGAFFTSPPHDGYAEGDIWYFENSQIWPGMNLLSIPDQTIDYKGYYKEIVTYPVIGLTPGKEYTSSLVSEVVLGPLEPPVRMTAMMFGYTTVANTYIQDVMGSSSLPMYSDGRDNGKRLTSTWTADALSANASPLIAARFSRWWESIETSIKYSKIMLNEGPERPYEPSPYLILGGDSGYMIATKSNDHLDVNDFIKFDPKSREYPTVFSELPFGYKQGDLYEWDINKKQIWPSYNAAAIDSAGRTRLYGESAVTPGSGFSISRGLSMVTRQQSSSGTSYYFAGSYTSTPTKGLEWIVDHFKGKRIKVTCRAWSNADKPLRIYVYYWQGSSILVPNQPVAEGFDLTEVYFDIPSDITNFLVAIRQDNMLDVGSTIAFKDLTIQVDGHEVEKNPQTRLSGATKGVFASSSDGLDFNFDKWSPYTGKVPDIGVSTSYPMTYDYFYGEERKAPRPLEHSYIYDYVYEGWGQGNNGVFILKNHSRYLGKSIGSPLEVTIYGPAKDPYWNIVKGSEVLQSDGFNIEIPEGYKLVVSSVPQDQKAVLVDRDGVESSVYQQQKLELSNFVTAPIGESVLIFYNCDSVAYRMREERVIV